MSKTMTQAQHYEMARRKLADANNTFMEMVNSKENPLTRSQLEKLIEHRPALWGKFSNWLDRLPG